MNRRKFFKWLGVGTAVAAVAPSALLAEGPACVAEIAPALPAVTAAVIGEYSNYYSFSSLAIATAIDESLAETAKELAYRAGQGVKELYAVHAQA